MLNTCTVYAANMNDIWSNYVHFLRLDVVFIFLSNQAYDFQLADNKTCNKETLTVSFA